jgi:cytochrome c-type biogenesis protein CcmH
VRLLPLLVALAALAAASPAAASERHPTQSELEGRIMCPICGTTLDQSRSPAAQQMKRFIAQRIRAGDTRSEIEARLVDDYGPAALAAPPKRGFDLLAWALPVAGLGAGALVVGFAAWRWSRSRDGDDAADERLDPALERRVEEALARYE